MQRKLFLREEPLSKAYNLTKRFSEDIDIAVTEVNSFSGNQLKMLIKRLVKDMAAGLNELENSNLTSKGSRYYKAIYQYQNLAGIALSAVKMGQIQIEINTYANPYPYKKHFISSFLTEYLTSINRMNLIEQYNLQAFAINVLDKRKTLVEKMVSLFRFSFAKDPITALSSKIRHFYDLYYLINDAECTDYVLSEEFKNDFQELFMQDQQLFNEPLGWATKCFRDSPLCLDFPAMWSKLSLTYRKELTPLAFSEIPKESLLLENFMTALKNLVEAS